MKEVLESSGWLWNTVNSLSSLCVLEMCLSLQFPLKTLSFPWHILEWEIPSQTLRPYVRETEVPGTTLASEFPTEMKSLSSHSKHYSEAMQCIYHQASSFYLFNSLIFVHPSISNSLALFFSIIVDYTSCCIYVSCYSIKIWGYKEKLTRFCNHMQYRHLTGCGALSLLSPFPPSPLLPFSNFDPSLF